MANQKILEIIGSFSAEEKAEFSLFLKSPFFVREDHADYLLRLFSCLVNASTQPRADIPDISDIHALAFPGKAFSEARLERAFTQLNQLIEQFLVTRHYQKEENEPQRALDYAGILREKRLALKYEQKLRQIKKEVNKNPLESNQNYHFRYQLAREEHEWRSDFNTLKGDLVIAETIQNLDFFYFSERIELLNRLLLQQKIITLKTSDVNQLSLELPSYYIQYEVQSPLLQIRKKVQELLLQDKPSKQDIEMLMDFINTHESHFPSESIHELYTYLRNFCTFLFNHCGQFEMAEVLHKIQKDNLARGYLYYKGKIAPHTLINITRIALRVKQIQWAKQFISLHRSVILSDDETEAHYKFNVALCFFAENKYTDALEYILFPPHFPLLYLESRRLELKIYYELHSDLLSYKIDAFRKYLERTARKTIVAPVRYLNINFVKMLLQLMQSKPKDIVRSRKLTKRLEEKIDYADLQWLREKALELA